MKTTQRRIDELAQRAVHVASGDWGEAECLVYEAGELAASEPGIGTPYCLALFPTLVGIFWQGRIQAEEQSANLITCR